MLPADDYLRRLPAGLILADRIAAEAIVFASDAFFYAYAELDRHVDRLFAEPEAVGLEVRTAVFSAAWTCIDQAHALRQLLPDTVREETETVGALFYHATEPARRLRNTMDHLRGNIRNLAARKGRPSPIFGAIFARADAIRQANGSVAIPTMMFLSSMLPSGHASPSASIDTLNLMRPGAIEFEAFGERVDLTDWRSKLSLLLPVLSERIATAIESSLEIQGFSAAEKVDALKPFGGEFFALGTIVLRESPQTNSPE